MQPPLEGGFLEGGLAGGREGATIPHIYKIAQNKKYLFLIEEDIILQDNSLYSKRSWDTILDRKD